MSEADETRRRFTLLDRLCGMSALLFLALVPGAIGWDHWVAELVIHWQLWAAGVLAISTVILLWRRRWILGGLATLGCAQGLIVLWPFAISGAGTVPFSEPTEGRGIVVASVNLFEDLSDHDRALDWLIARNPDLVVIQELTLNNAGSVVDRLKGALEYHHHAPKPGSFGIGIASRWPLEVVPLKGGGQTQLVATIETPTGPVRLVGVHVWPPLRRAWSHRQRSTLKRIGAQVTASEGPVIVAGDFNLTPWSPTFERFLESTDLRDPRIGRGLLATWSPASWSGFPLIPIDHILVSKEWKVGSLEVGPAFGSDHRPLIATLVR